MPAKKKAPAVVPAEHREKNEKIDKELEAKAVQEAMAKVEQAERDLTREVMEDVDTMARDGLRVSAAPSFSAPDLTMFPEYVDVDGERIRLRDSEKVYRWVRFRGRHPKVTQKRLKHWRSTRTNKGFESLGFERTVEGYVVNGDCVLMEISRDGFNRLRRDIEALRDWKANAASKAYANQIHRLGMDVVEEVDGRNFFG